MYWWPEFERGEVAEEFDVVASLGMTVVRIFLLWDDWQPSPATVSSQRLHDLGIVLDLASERSLGVDVTFFTGHMSGPNWSPGWLLDPGATANPSPDARQVVSGGEVVDSKYRNMFHDEAALDAERLLLEQVVTAYRDHPGVWMWNLGNEPDLFARPRDADAGRAWVREMTQLVKGIDPGHPVTTGLHTANLFAENGLRVDDVFAESDVAVMHGYPMYVDWARDPLDPEFVPYLCALVSALTGKPCLAEEWGGCTSPDTEGSVTWEWHAYGAPRSQLMAGEEAFADYVYQVLPRLVEVGATGAFMWCFADYHPDLWDRPPCDEGGARHERHFGLVRPDGTIKPHADVIRRFAETSPTIGPAAKTVTLDITPDQYYLDPAFHARRLYETW
jgi:endo-1,4-beta-mannosidase